MLTLPSATPVYLAVGATDMRKSIDSLAALVQEGFGLNPFAPGLFVFCNQARCGSIARVGSVRQLCSTTTSRDEAASTPRRFLSGFTGYLHTDGYSGYNRVKGVTQLGCWSHARRKYHEALQAVPAAQRAQTAAATGLDFCNQLFEVERKYRDATPEERHAARQQHSKPILERFHAWLTEQQLRVLPKGLLGTAVTYTLNQWEKLNVFLEDGRLELDNNRSERSIKPFVIGRNYVLNFVMC